MTNDLFFMLTASPTSLTAAMGYNPTIRLQVPSGVACHKSQLQRPNDRKQLFLGQSDGKKKPMLQQYLNPLAVSSSQAGR